MSLSFVGDTGLSFGLRREPRVVIAVGCWRIPLADARRVVEASDRMVRTARARRRVKTLRVRMGYSPLGERWVRIRPDGGVLYMYDDYRATRRDVVAARRLLPGKPGKNKPKNR